MRLAELLADKTWRHLEMIDPGGGGGGDGIDWGAVAGAAAGLLGVDPPPDLGYNPGPSPSPSIGGRNGSSPSSAPSPPPDIFAGFLGPEIDMAKQITQQFLTLMGFPHDIDANQLTLQILNARLTGNMQEAMSLLFNSGQGITDQMRVDHEWAQFGMDAASYQTRKATLDTMFNELIGQDPEYLKATGGTDLQQLYFSALRGGLNQQEVLQRLQTDPKFADLLKDQPWLVAGQTFGAAKQAFSSIYGTAPVDTPTLAAWWRFNTGAQQLSRTGREAQTTAAPVTSTSEGR